MMNNAQKTSLCITLDRLEAWLTEAQAMLHHNGMRARLTPDAVAQLRAMAEVQQSIIDDLMRRFDLPRETTDDVRRLAAGLSMSWSQLHDSKSDKLRRYGEVHPALPESLDPDLDRLIDLTMHMIRLLEQST